ncbi:RNA-binding protein [Vagococcus entomophilus]|uniref:RNA-binding protein n=1 Tax=Vagococcus entomophilus TaxID=1160095 RepID=A0A430AIH8_9ENTE|nr:RNA-binding protein [Vagococcus entomophilus]RSU07838.1 RNA-binding protein [Vagococcus entomophilus]
MNVNVYQHFRKEEHSFIDLVKDWQEQVEMQYAPYLTDFLDPRQAYILETLIRQNGELKFKFYGGYEQAERRRALIFPDYYIPEKEEYNINLYEIIYPIKFGMLSHGKILGTFLSTGVKRESLGDIISDGERWQIYIKGEIAEYFHLQIKKIGSLPVRLEKRNYTDMIVAKDEWSLEHTTVSSLRLDNLISNVYNISRQRSKQLIDSGKIKINWTECTRPDFTLDLLDIISVRGFGRIQLKAIEGKTKKEKYRLLLGILRK